MWPRSLAHSIAPVIRSGRSIKDFTHFRHECLRLEWLAEKSRARHESNVGRKHVFRIARHEEYAQGWALRRTVSSSSTNRIVSAGMVIRFWHLKSGNSVRRGDATLLGPVCCLST